jgi:nitroimidazol reductase NimA-like FMN-containing flavoprotein (pyridoxamine 5'-phosphate oxidase superfamily)
LDEFTENGLNGMEGILKQAEVGRLALSDGSKPYVIPLNFLYKDGKIAFHCAWKGKKLDLISKNPNCCFEVDEFMGEVSYHYDSKCHLNYYSVLAFGKASVENQAEEKIRLLQLFSEKYNELYKKPISEGGIRFTAERVDECCCVVIDVEELTGRWERTVNGERKLSEWRHLF